ncbi:MAG: GtrA family protein [Hyphomicrobiales bacterium]|nr:GtrA family protein [Hyphomicrobiales bacterium]
MKAPAAKSDRVALGSAEPKPIGEAGLFLRFSAVGAVGFVVDAGLLLLLVHAFKADPIAARLLSFSVAVAVTFHFNRRWALGAIRQGSVYAAFATYLSVQSVGLLCNIVTYTALILLLPETIITPLVCVAFASAAALFVNYGGIRRLVFKTKGE